MFDLEAERRRAGGTHLEITSRGDRSAGDLTTLLRLLAEGGLDLHVDLRTDWSDHEAAVRALLARQVAGKVVLDVRRGSASTAPRAGQEIGELRK